MGEGHNNNKKCGDDQMLVKLTNSVHGINRNYSKCFPKTQCKCANIEKELNDNAAHMPGAKVKILQCGLQKEDAKKKETDEDGKADEDDTQKETDEDEQAGGDDTQKKTDEVKQADE